MLMPTLESHIKKNLLESRAAISGSHIDMMGSVTSLVSTDILADSGRACAEEHRRHRLDFFSFFFFSKVKYWGEVVVMLAGVGVGFPLEFTSGPPL